MRRSINRAATSVRASTMPTTRSRSQSSIRSLSTAGRAFLSESADIVGPVRRSVSPSGALSIFLWSRLALWATAVFALLAFVPNRHPNADRWDSPRLHELGYGIDVWARWDSDWYLLIAQDGYSGSPSSTPAFFPLYPGLIAGLGRLLAGHYVLAGVLLSLAACALAFVLLH